MEGALFVEAIIPNIKRKNIVQSNELTEAAYSMSRDEKRILYICLSQIPHKAEGHHGKFEIEVGNYAKVFNLSPHEASRDVRTAAKNLMGCKISFFLPKEDSYDEKATDVYNLLSKASYRPQRGMHVLHFNPELMPFLLSLSQKFTKYKIEETDSLNSPYAMRLYESLCQYRSTGYLVRPVEWIIERYQLPASYNRYPDFRRRFLEPSVREINASTPFNVVWKERKIGRKVNAIEFLFGPKPDFKVTNHPI